MEPSMPPSGDSSLPSEHATFDAEWTFQSPGRLFANLPPKPRAWERLPRQRQALSSTSANTTKKARTIWKRHQSRDQLSLKHNDFKAEQQPPAEASCPAPSEVVPLSAVATEDMPTPDGKIVKRVRLGVDSGFTAAAKKRSAALWDRRRSILPHKTPKIPVFEQDNGFGDTDIAATDVYEPSAGETEEEHANLDDNLKIDAESAAALLPIPAAELVTDDPPVTNLDDNSDELQPIFPVEEASSTAVESQPTACDVEESGAPLETEHLVNKDHVPQDMPNEEAHARSEMQAAGAQHLEEMRRKLSSKLSRVGRRRTDFVPSTLHTPPRQQQRRISAAVDTFRPDTSRSAPKASHENDVEANTMEPDDQQAIEATLNHNGIVEPFFSEDDLASQVSAIVEVSAVEIQHSPMSSTTEEHAQLDADEPLGSLTSSSLFAEKEEDGEDQATDAQRSIAEQEDPAIQGEVEAILEDVVETAVDAVVNEALISDAFETAVTDMEIGENIRVDQVVVTSEGPPEETVSSTEEVIIQSHPVDMDEVPSPDPNVVETTLLEPLPEDATIEQISAPIEAETQVASGEFLTVQESSQVEMTDAPELEQDASKQETAIESPVAQEPELQTMREDTSNPNVDNQQATLYTPVKSPGAVSTVKVSLNDDDTDILKDFLSRAKASKAAKIANQSSAENRRDSDVVKHALASPRRLLEDLDANSPSPRKEREGVSNEGTSLNKGEETFDASEESSPTPKVPNTSVDDNLPESGDVANNQPLTRRRTRGSESSSSNMSAKRSAAPTAAPSTISVRLQDGSEQVVLKKSEAQELAILTRTNTRRNKGGAVPAREMILRLKGVPVDDNAQTDESLASEGKVRWNEELVAYFEEGKDNRLQQLGDANTSETAVSKPRARRAKMLGAMNGTPAKVRAKDGEFTSLLERNTADLPNPAFTVPSDAADATTELQQPAETQDDDPPALSRASKAKQDAPSRATRTVRRIPTPAKPLKQEVQSTAPMRTRHNSAPGQIRREYKENSEAAAAKEASQPKGVVQTRSGAGVGRPAEAPKRSMVPRRGAKR